MADAWAPVCPDPTPLIDPAGPGDERAAGALLARRGAAFAPVQEHYFTEPPRIERGWRQHLFDTAGRSYVDMLNNVSILGHGHPRLSDAIENQWRLLNTNSRFHYGAVVEFAERLAELVPEPLDTVFLVNSGTEADDLALRLAWANTGRRDVLAVREAYHGWSDATDAISTSVADNPNALETRPAWVHTLAAPNAYRGRYRGARARRYAEDAVAYVRDMVADGRPPGGVPVRAVLRQRRRDGPAGRVPERRSTPRCATPAGCASPTRSRWGTAGWGSTSGASSSRASCRTSSPWRRRWATATPSAR